MKMKYFILAATAITMMASCADEKFVGDENLLGAANGEGAISFNMNTPALTRAADKTGSDAAGDLNNQFIVWGEKNEAGDGTAAGASNLVFKNYIVNYATSTAYTTTSNTKNWEYVGYKFDDSSASPSSANYSTNVTPNTKGESVVAQTIKYWDFGATRYTFTAVSALPADITGNKIVITKNTTGTSSSDYNKGYDIEVKTGASLDDIFVADRNVITSAGGGTDREAVNKYGGNVTMKFRNFMSKIRFGIYETIPGYKVKITGVNYNSTTSTTNFGVDGKFLTVGDGSSTHTKFTVTYENPSNKALVDVKSGTTPASTSYFETVVDESSTTKIYVPFLNADYIGTTATGATFNKTVKEGDADPVPGVYTTVIPFSSNDTNIKLRVSYKLISEDTSEEIVISEKTVEVPNEYCQWKSNYAYSYLFKITDGDLYPITFDAVEVVDENGLAEYITTVSQPSITTFGVVLNSSSEFKNYVTGKNEYQLPGGSDKLDIYTTFLKGEDVLTPQTDQAAKANYVKVYSVDYKAGATDAEKAEKPITELSVANAIEHTGGLITATDITSDATTYFTVAPAKVTTVTAEDGKTKTIDALKLTGVKAAGKYAVEIVTYEAVTGLTVGTSVVTGYYTESGGTYTKIDADDTKAADGTTYYKQVKTYKVITVQAAP